MGNVSELLQMSAEILEDSYAHLDTITLEIREIERFFSASPVDYFNVDIDQSRRISWNSGRIMFRCMTIDMFRPLIETPSGIRINALPYLYQFTQKGIKQLKEINKAQEAKNG